MKVVITGGSSGLGYDILNEMTRYADVTDWSLKTGVDLRDPEQIRQAAANVKGNVDILINCAGVNEIAWFEELNLQTWDNLMNVNARAIWLTTRALLPQLKNGTILNIVSNAAHLPMTCSLAYNASKAAALMITKQLARELIKTHGITVFSVSPNKLAGTGMSNYIDARVCSTRGWTPEQAKSYQLAGLPAGQETDPLTLAEFIAFLLQEKERHMYLNGCDIPYGGP